jgi:PAS domain S-box-containing protein
MSDTTAERTDDARLRAAAVASATAGMVITDPTRPDNPIVDVNAAFERMTGYARHEVLGRNCRFLQGPETDPLALARMREAIAAGREETVTLLNYRQDGAPFWNELRVAPLRDDTGRITHFVGVQTDVSAQVAAGADRDRLAAIVESSADAIVGKTLDGIITDWNPAAERLYGYRAKEVLGRPVAMLAPPELAGEIAGFLATIRAGGKVVDRETVRVTRDGRRLRVALTISPVRDGADRIVGASTIARDIGERRRSEAALRQALRAAETASETLAILERVGRLLAAELNHDALERGIAAAGLALTGAATGALVRVDDLAGAYAWVVSAGGPADGSAGGREEATRRPLPGLDAASPGLAAGQAGGPIRVDDVRRDGRIDPDRPHPALPADPATAALLAAPVVSRSGEMLGELVFAHPQPGAFDDRAQALAVGLAAQAAVALDNARLYREARDAVAARDRFLSTAAHELRTPMAALKGRVQLLRRWRAAGTLSDERLGDGLVASEELVGRLHGLVDDLLEVARLRLDAAPHRPRPLDIGDLVRRAVEHQRARADDRGQLAVAVAPGLPPVLGDPGRLAQVVDQLLDNAVKHSPHGGAIRVSVDPSEEGVLVRVADGGIGLSAGTEEAIFQPFGRSANAVDLVLPGLGLGLHLARGIVEQHRGRIWAESPGPNRGATFLVWLPAAPAP